ncbi:hypothetical protein DFH09DRAFT_1274498 [Mycena vulgaris]|nr:hypothetical protein DFH09DRAFT_1274498 [Mycena vulgaris]
MLTIPFFEITTTGALFWHATKYRGKSFLKAPTCVKTRLLEGLGSDVFSKRSRKALGKRSEIASDADAFRDPTDSECASWWRGKKRASESHSLPWSPPRRHCSHIALPIRMQHSGVQLAQELVDHIIDFIDDPTDLQACALVSRGWVYAAQSHIFKQISIGRPETRKSDIDAFWSRCRATLHASPHLIRHIHRLELHPRRISAETLSAICNFHFTHLKEAYTPNFTLSWPLALGIRQLFSLPSLRLVGITCRFAEWATFLQIWERCAPDIKHLDLTCHQIAPQILVPILQSPSTPIRLEALRITAVEGLRDWVHHPLWPFDLSGLKVLSIFIYTEVLRWPEIAPALGMIQVLDYSAYAAEPPIDLSLLPDLALLRLFVYAPDAWPRALDTLATMGPTNRIRKVVLCGALAGVNTEVLDFALSRIPPQPSAVFEFETNATYYDRLAPSLHRLNAKSMLRRVDPREAWFKNFVRSFGG